MQTFFLFVQCVLITVSSGLIQNHAFMTTGGAVSMEFDFQKVTAGVKSRLQCAALCDQHSWCLAIGWDKETKTCQKLSRTLTPDTTSNLFATNKGQGYTYISGMIVKFFQISGSFSWQDSQNYCVNEGGRLAVIDTLEKYNALTNIHHLAGLWWVGSTQSSGTWTWTTGQAMAPNIPIVVDDSYACLSFYFGQLNDSGCEWDANFICEK